MYSVPSNDKGAASALLAVLPQSLLLLQGWHCSGAQQQAICGGQQW
jgi:hypothetical protein